MTVPPYQPADRYEYPPAYYAPGWRPPASRWDGVSIAALATGLAGLGPVPVVLGAVGVRRTTRTGRRGRWMAWTGLALGCLTILAYAAAALLVWWLLLRPLPADVAAPRWAVVTQVSEGNCLDPLEPDGSVLFVRAVPCANPHEVEVAAVRDLGVPPRSSSAADDDAAALCRDAVPEGTVIVWAPATGRTRVACLVPAGG